MINKVKTHGSTLKTDKCLIPGDLQVNCNLQTSQKGPFKTAYKDLYNEWIPSDEKSLTADGNDRAPDKLLCLKGGGKKAWNMVTLNVFFHSFKPCGIFSSNVGSDDNFIHFRRLVELSTAQRMFASTI